MVCRYCGKEMIKDDVDFRFKGNKDIYWICECGVFALEKIRYGKTIKVDFDKEVEE